MCRIRRTPVFTLWRCGAFYWIVGEVKWQHHYIHRLAVISSESFNPFLFAFIRKLKAKGTEVDVVRCFEAAFFFSRTSPSPCRMNTSLYLCSSSLLFLSLPEHQSFPLVSEPEFPYLEALAPFQPLAMKVRLLLNFSILQCAQKERRSKTMALCVAFLTIVNLEKSSCIYVEGAVAEGSVAK